MCIIFIKLINNKNYLLHSAQYTNLNEGSVNIKKLAILQL